MNSDDDSSKRRSLIGQFTKYIRYKSSDTNMICDTNIARLRFLLKAKEQDDNNRYGESKL